MREMKEIREIAAADVLVCGGGCAGCAAALGAAKAGADVILLERGTYLGGIAASSMISNVYNHYVTRDGRLVMRGIGLEWMQRMVKKNAAAERWQYPDGRLVHDPEQMKVTFDEMMADYGVKVLYRTMAMEPYRIGNRAAGAYVNTPDGPALIRAEQVVDTTGECDMAWGADAPVRYACGMATLTFKFANVDLEKLYRHFKNHPETFPVGIDAMKNFEEFEKVWLERDVLYFPHSGGEDWDLFQDAIKEGRFKRELGDIFAMDSCCIIGRKGTDTAVINSQMWRIRSLDPFVLSDAESRAHEAVYYVADFMVKNIPGFEHAYVAQISDELALRVSRGIEGSITFDKDEHTTADKIVSDDPTANGTDIEYNILRGLTDDPRYAKSADKEEDIYAPDVIACRPRQMNFKRTGEFVSRATVDIPFGVMVPKGVENLLAASGKGVSAVPQTMLRYQSAGMALGQAAGAAAALAARLKITVRSLDIHKLQKELLEQDVWLGGEKRLKELGLLAEAGEPAGNGEIGEEKNEGKTDICV
ncbi:FAD-dependent oxidoreductase [Lachnotalea sp. AF33-28]|uniref:FAD-dependent oxidoreductase n=1 Tax=Lachnotalea sp. AF33-28 TaxID=2292046 RepID=UPI00131415B9|nr:FAD-dependent oxidoreductase [Lachnotalea sp. AF33-28]